MVPPQDWYWVDTWHIDMSDLDHDENNWQVCSLIAIYLGNIDLLTYIVCHELYWELRVVHR